MAKVVAASKTVKKKPAALQSLSLEPLNYQIILAGFAVIIAGYFALSAKPWDNPVALNVAPVLLVLGYCVIIPFGIMYRRKKDPAAAEQNTPSA